jgi:hypothetical protein
MFLNRLVLSAFCPPSAANIFLNKRIEQREASLRRICCELCAIPWYQPELHLVCREIQDTRL